ncbi:MAG TPA: ATP synthase F1 subunit gamma [Bacillota bacterium]|jgi:F-type H+-transporting ATPase subunit gamma|nr:ATP synthase F1 subunit gamma [Bacillota bacterium]
MAGSSMRDIKRRIKSVNGIEHITSAMKLVSSAKLRKAKNIFEKSRRNFHYITEAIEEVFYNTEDVPHLYLKGSRDIKRKVYIVVTSCRGLCGSFNSNVIKHTQKLIDEYHEEEPPLIVAVGSKGREHFARRDYEIAGDYCLPPEDISFIETQEIGRPLIDMYNRGEIDEIVLVTTSFINSLEQKVYDKTILPLEIKGDPYTHKVVQEVEYEPSAKEVFNYLIPKYVEIMIYNAIIESATCEHAARRMAMENATDNANEMIADLTLTYNRTRQAAITNEISEIVGGAEALS